MKQRDTVTLQLINGLRLGNIEILGELRGKFSTDNIPKLDNLFDLFNKRLSHLKEIIENGCSIISKEEQKNLQAIEKETSALFEEFQHKKFLLEPQPNFDVIECTKDTLICLIGLHDSYESLKEAVLNLYKKDTNVIYALKKIIGIHIEGIAVKENSIWPWPSTIIQNAATSVINCFWRNPPEDETIRCAKKLLVDLTKTNSDKEEKVDSSPLSPPAATETTSITTESSATNVTSPSPTPY